jgi:hypothetical protein
MTAETLENFYCSVFWYPVVDSAFNRNEYQESSWG